MNYKTMDDIYEDILKSMLSNIKNVLFEEYIDYEQFEKTKQNWNDKKNLIFRSYVGCSCEDESCPHKSNISILGIGSMFRTFNRCIKLKGSANLVKEFNPIKCEIKSICILLPEDYHFFQLLMIQLYVFFDNDVRYNLIFQI